MLGCRILNIDQVWWDYSRQLRAFILAKTGSPDDADDILQDVLLKTHRQLGSLRTQDKLKPWLFKIANHALIDFYRKRARHPAAKLESSMEVAIIDDDDVELELSQCVLPFIDALPEESAQLLRRIDIEGASQKAYAQALGISYPALKSRVQRARRQLRSVFERCCELELDAKGAVIDYLPRQSACQTCSDK